MDKEDMVNIYNGILLSAIKNNEILSFSTIKMDLKGIILSKMSETNTICCHYVWNLKTKQNKSRLIDTEKR